MRIEISGEGFRTELQIMPQRRAAFDKATVQDIDAVSTETMWKVKRTIPVDTGRARATWGIFTPELLVYISTKNPVNPAESIWRVSDGGFTIEQGLDLRPYNYPDELNAGSSRQAPAMFLDVIAEQAGDLLVSRVVRNADHL